MSINIKLVNRLEVSVVRHTQTKGDEDVTFLPKITIDDKLVHKEVLFLFLRHLVDGLVDWEQHYWLLMALVLD